MRFVTLPRSFRSFSILVLSAAALSLSSCSTTSETASKANGPRFLDNVALSNNCSSQLRLTTGSIQKNRLHINPASSNAMQEKYAGILGVLPNALTNVPLYRFIDEWIGVRYRLGGLDENGIDCSAFMQRLYASVFGINLLRTAADQFSMANLLFGKDELKEGDLVFFKIRTSRISHVGMYLANGYFVHSCCSRGVAISSLDESYWSHYYAGGGRIL